MTQPSVFRLNCLRCGYLLLVVGLGSTVWPAIVASIKDFEAMHGVVVCMLGSLSAVAVLGLRYPLRMLPLLFFEMGWKVLWLLRVALPLWSANRLDAAAAETAFACSIAIIFPVVIPWSYVCDNYLVKPADPWRRKAAVETCSRLKPRSETA